MSELLEVLRVQGARVNLKINVTKTKSLMLGISEDEKVKLGNEKIDQVDSFTYLSSIISKQELRAHMALVTRREELRAKRSYGMSSNKIL